MYIKHDAKGALPKGTHHPGWCYTACLTSNETLFSHKLIEALPICFQRKKDAVGDRRRYSFYTWQTS